MGKTNTKLEFLLVKKLNNIKVRKLYILASKSTFLGQNRLKTHIDLWVALIAIAYRVTYI
jgi:hypothetical protein